MAEYFMSNGGRYGNLWKKEDFTDYFFSLKSFEWIKCKWVMILPCFNEISEKDALQFIETEKASGPYEEEQLPVRYFLSDMDYVYATDVVGNEFSVLIDKSLKPIPEGTIDCMWGGIGEDEVEVYLNAQNKENVWHEEHRWINQILTRWHGDYYVDVYQDDKVFSIKVYFEDMCGNTEMVDYKEFATLEEAKSYAEKRINRE